MTQTMSSGSFDRYASAGYQASHPQFSFKDSFRLREKKRSLAKCINDYQKDKGWKIRSNNPENAVQSDKNHSPTAEEKSSPQKQSTNNKGEDCILDTEANPIRSKLLGQTTMHPDNEFCVCEHCTCGRHLCKVHVDRPVLHHTTGYRRDFGPKFSIQNFQLRHAESPTTAGKLKPLSTYGKDFYPKIRSVDAKFKPQDCIKDEGPFMGSTTYGSCFPNYKLDSLYPRGRIMGGEHVNSFPFTGNTTYRKEYSPKRVNPYLNEVKDSIKPGDTFLGSTTYSSSFQKPDGDYRNPWLATRRSCEDPNFNHQYETTYRNDYLRNQPTMCPAKIELETRSKGFLRSSKMTFQENADFKAMDPEFHAISTSKLV